MRVNTKEAVALRAGARRAKLQRELDRMLPLVEQQPGVRLVLLFGSMGRQDAGSRSDLDLVIVQNTEKRFMDRLDEFYRLLVPSVGTDILVYTPAEWEELKETRGFGRTVSAEGRVLYDAAKSARG